MGDKVMTLHPQGKRGVNIDRVKYETIKAEIVGLLKERGRLGFVALVEAVDAQLAGRFDGSVSWYVTTVKLDLEARGVIGRLPGMSPQQLELRGG